MMKTQSSAIDASVVAYGTAMGGATDHVYDENCLGLNVWGKPQTGESAKAVLVWIYGGGKSLIYPRISERRLMFEAFGSGTSHAPFYNGARLAAEQDVIVVSMK
jgi:cholinesterase